MAVNRAAALDTTPGFSVHAVVVRAGLLAAMVAVGIAIVVYTDGVATAVVVPVLLLVAGWLLREVWQRLVDCRALARARTAQQPPQTGQWIAVEGTAVALEEPFTAPLSSRLALACRYQVHYLTHSTVNRSNARSRRRWLRYEGFHLAAMAIDGHHGRVLLRAIPDLSDLPASGVSGGLSPSGSTPTPGPRILRFAARAQLLTRPHPRAHIDWRYRDDDANAEGKTEGESHERVVEPGATVCVLGRWADGALLPSRSRPRGIPVYDGPAERVLPKLRGETWVYLVMGLIALAGALGLLWYAL